jgi:hypothetical protein
MSAAKTIRAPSTRGNLARRVSIRISTPFTLNARFARPTFKANARKAGVFCRRSTTMAVTPAERSSGLRFSSFWPTSER